MAVSWRHCGLWATPAHAHSSLFDIHVLHSASYFFLWASFRVTFVRAVGVRADDGITIPVPILLEDEESVVEFIDLPYSGVSHLLFFTLVGSRVVSALDSGAEGPGFKSQSRR